MKIVPNCYLGIEVLIDGHRPKKTYTTFDAVNSVINITTPQNLRFDEVRITLEV